MLVSALLALASSVLWGTGDFLGGVSTKRANVLIVVVITQAVGLVVVGTLALATGAWQAPSGYWPWAVLGGLCGASGLMAFYWALSEGSMGVVAPIAAMSGIVPLAAGLLSGDRLQAITWIGAAAIGCGVVLASGPELRAVAGWRPLALALVAALLFGVALLAIARGSQFSTVMMMTSMRLTSVSVFTVVVVIALTRRVIDRAGIWEVRWALIGCGVFDVLANLAYGASANAGPLVITAVLGSLYPVITAILAAVLLHERLQTVQYLGVGFALTGLVLVTLG